MKDGHRAGDVVESIRALFSKDDHGKKAPLDVNELIREVLRLVHDVLQKEQASVRTELFNGLPRVLANRVQLQLVLRNLIMNAIEAMSSVSDRRRVLHVKSELSERSGVRITVTDSGPGIDPKIVDRIFDAFFTTKSQGMGMGLSICRSIVEAHDGRLSAAPAPVHGSVLQVVLPASGPATE